MKYRGIRLGLVRFRDSGHERYRIRIGRSVAYARADALPQDWSDIYVQWHRERGELHRAASLRWARKGAAS